MNKLSKKYNIKIPTDVVVVYSKKRKILTFLGPLKTKSVILKVQVFIDQFKKIIKVSSLPFSQVSNKEKKAMRILQNTAVAKIKYMLIESSMLVYKKLKIIGVGYRTNFTENFDQKLLTFKLGYSHLIYVRILNNLMTNCLTKTKLCVFGCSYEKISQFLALVRNNKIPEPYKGKGILYENENIKIKEGKKV